MHLDCVRIAAIAMLVITRLGGVDGAAPGAPQTVGDVLPRFAPAFPAPSPPQRPPPPSGSRGISFQRPPPRRGSGGGVQPSIATTNEVRERVNEPSGGNDDRSATPFNVNMAAFQGGQGGSSSPNAFARPPLDAIAPRDFGEHSIPPPPTTDDDDAAVQSAVWPSRNSLPPLPAGAPGTAATRPQPPFDAITPLSGRRSSSGGAIDADGDDPSRMSAASGDRPLPGDVPDGNNQRGPILPVRPPGRNLLASNWNISDAAAAGLIEGQNLDASQEGRCVVCGPRNNFDNLDPTAQQSNRGDANRDGDDGDRDSLQSNAGVDMPPPRRPDAAARPSPPLPQRLPISLLPLPSWHPLSTHLDVFPNPRRLSFGELDLEDRLAIIRTCRTKLDCKLEPFGSAQKRHDVHRSELEVQRRYAPHKSEASLVRRLNKIHMVKLLMLNAAGLAGHVLPINDGTIEQDVLLTEAQAEHLLHKLHVARRSKRASIYLEQLPTLHWEFGEPIPYTFDESMDTRNQQMIQLALRAIEASTCIRFQFSPTKPAIHHIFYAKIPTPTFCGLSYIGKISPANPIYLSFACGDPIGVAIHETMHALGVNHEHLRVDRDKFLRMRWDNINPQYYDYFAISDPLSYTSYGVPFDYESIMMYGPFTGAVDSSRPTIEAIDDDDGTTTAKMGQRKRLSRTDIALLNKMYCKPADCVDHNVFCGTWALRQLCFDAPQSAWMQRHCRRSCNLC